MYKAIKVLSYILVLSILSAQSNILVEIVNNSGVGVKATYQSSDLRKIEQFIESKHSYTIQNPNPERFPHDLTTQVLINTYKGPLNLFITAHKQSMQVPGHIRRRARFNPFAMPATTEEVPNLDIRAELSAEYPIANARFSSGRPWDEYKIKVIIDEKQIEKSTVSIAYKRLEKPETLIVHPVTRPASARRVAPGHFRQVVRTEYEPSEGLIEEVNLPSAAPMYQGSFDEQGNPIL